MAGRTPALWRVDVLAPAVPGKEATVDTYLCGSVDVREGALILSRAWLAIGNPGEPHDRIVLPLSGMGSAVTNYIGPIIGGDE